MIQITSLCDNVNNSKKLWSAEGNSLLIRAFGQVILFDTGRSGQILLHNLEAIGASADEIDAVILSHGHMGHIGAMRERVGFPAATVYYGAGLELPKLKLKGGKYVSVKNELLIDEVKGSYPSVEVDGMLELIPGRVYLFQVDASRPSQTAEEKYFVKRGESCMPDFFADEVNLAIRTERGLILLSGCAHCGVRGIIETATELFGEERILAVIGGTHLFDDTEKADRYISLMKERGVEVVAPSHCTGIMSRARIANALPDSFVNFSTGQTLEFEE